MSRRVSVTWGWDGTCEDVPVRTCPAARAEWPVKKVFGRRQDAEVEILRDKRRVPQDDICRKNAARSVSPQRIPLVKSTPGKQRANG